MCRLTCAAVLVGLSAALAGAAPPKSRGPKIPLPVGAEATVVVVGDEARLLPALGKTTVAMPDSLVLVRVSGDDRMSANARSIDFQADQELGRAIRARDPEGIRGVLSKGMAIRVQAGTRVRVLAVSFVNSSGRLIVADRLPIDRHGKRLVRITEGPATGKVVEIPTRNLRPAEDEAREGPGAKQGLDPARRAATLLRTGGDLEKLKKTRLANLAGGTVAPTPRGI
jgi:hypothetical protein